MLHRSNSRATFATNVPKSPSALRIYRMNAWDQFQPPGSDMAHPVKARRPRVLVLSNPDPDSYEDKEPRSPQSPLSGPQHHHLQHHIRAPLAPPAARPYHAPAHAHSPRTSSNPSPTPPYATSESSRSSPAAETSPPPSTPSFVTPPVGFSTDEKGGYDGASIGLGLKSIIHEEPMTKPEHPNHPRSAPAMPHNRRPSADAQKPQPVCCLCVLTIIPSRPMILSQPPIARDTAPEPRRVAIDKIVIQVTRDQEQYVVVDISNVREAKAIREHIFTSVCHLLDSCLKL